MKLYFYKKTQKIFTDPKECKKKFGAKISSVIVRRLAVLNAVSNLSEVPITKPERCHQLSQDRDEEFAVDLSENFRLVFKPVQFSRLPDGGIDKKSVTEVEILEVVDYHG